MSVAEAQDLYLSEFERTRGARGGIAGVADRAA